MKADKNGGVETRAERPFFDISPDDVSSQEHPPQSTMSGAPAPVSIQVGDLGTPVLGATSPAQLSGEVSSVGGMFQFQPTLNEPKQPFRWGQFFLGLFVPYIVFFLLTVVAEVSNQGGEDMPDFYLTKRCRWSQMTMGGTMSLWRNHRLNRSTLTSTWTPPIRNTIAS